MHLSQNNIASQVQAWIDIICMESVSLYHFARKIFFEVHEILHQIIYDIVFHYSKEWLTQQSCYELSYGLAFLCSILGYVKFTLLGLKLLGQLLTKVVDSLFITTSNVLNEAVNQFISRVARAAYFIITFIPRMIWRMIFNK